MKFFIPIPVRWFATFATGLVVIAAMTGCSSLAFPIQGRPVTSVPRHELAEPKRNLVPIDISLLSQPEPNEYRLDEGDVLGVIVEGIVPYRGPEQPPVLPPVQYPAEDLMLPPAIGVPLAVQPGGEIALWEIGRLNVRGMSLDQASSAIREAYIENEFLKPTAGRPVVTLIRPRQVNVLVIREDTGQNQNRISLLGNDNSATGGPVSLSAYKNDVLNALMASGGLPGLDAKNEIQIFRRRKENSVPQVPMALIDAGQFPPGAELELEQDERLAHIDDRDGPELVIPLRVPAGSQLDLAVEDIILNEGDIVYIANRTTEVFYTGGLLPAGQHLLPRDYDIDVFDAMSIAGYSYGASISSGSGGGLIPTGAQVPATQLFVFRETPGGCDRVIEIDLSDAVQCCNQRLIVKPGDTIFLRHNCCEEATNFGIMTFFTYGIRELFR